MTRWRPHVRAAALVAVCLVASSCRADDRPAGGVGSTSVATTSVPATPAAAESTSPESTQPEQTQPEQTQPEQTQPEQTQPESTQPGTAATGPTAGDAPADVVTLEGSVTDPARSREIPYLVYAPVGRPGPTPVILVSHGGTGNALGHLSAPHLGSTFAAGGFVAIHLAHLPSNPVTLQLEDRPADVSFLLDQLEAGAIAMPVGFSGTVDITRVGHTGHSFGAYTSHAVGGATYSSTERRTYRDDRIDAIAPISPQGPDQFGGFVNGPGGPDDTTWSTIDIPVYDLIGGDEIDSNAVDSVSRPGWRLAPFDNYPGTSDTFRTIIDGQVHSDMWRTGTDEVKAFIAAEILEFMTVYVADSSDPSSDQRLDACGVGVGQLSLAHTERHPGGTDSAIGACP